jgi:hypothetical protein
MFAQFHLVVQMRFCVRALTLAATFVVLNLAGLMYAQDTRTVLEPTYPATCTALAAQQAIANGEPSSETTFDTSTIQTALNACPSGQAVELTTTRF